MRDAAQRGSFCVAHHLWGTFAIWKPLIVVLKLVFTMSTFSSLVWLIFFLFIYFFFDVICTLVAARSCVSACLHVWTIVDFADLIQQWDSCRLAGWDRCELYALCSLSPDCLAVSKMRRDHCIISVQSRLQRTRQLCRFRSRFFGVLVFLSTCQFWFSSQPLALFHFAPLPLFPLSLLLTCQMMRF